MLVCFFCALFLIPPERQFLPSQRAAATYRVYDAALGRKIENHSSPANTNFISDHTAQTYDIPGADKCLQVPEQDRAAFLQAVADFRAQAGKVYRLEEHFHFSQHKVHLLTPEEESAVLQKLADGRPVSDPQLQEATDIIRLSNVGFNSDRSLAILIVSNYCGVVCGSEEWRVFKHGAKGWIEQPWNRCAVVSWLRFIRPGSAADA